ncbi:P-loop NTPase fold protein [Acinetobacter guillouiae]|uniref:KAP family P-loop NTPase fold protein n=1 Tax=Acinetobacter guillouiae TaxID=106649 RepID=UPI0028E731FA|nr:P-loop NTPase fold protein [Acinetobacter guillouiae]
MNQQSKFIKERDEIITEPFKGDLWGRKQLSDKLTNFVSNLNCGATIALDAEWGAGKTWFINNWHADLTAKNFNVISIDAFKHDFIEDPFLILSMEILNAVDVEKNLADRFKNRLISTYQAILPNLPMLLYSFAMTAIGAGHVSKSLAKVVSGVTEGAGDFGGDAGELLEEQLREHLTESVENYNKSKNELGYFRDELSKLVEDLEKPLVFIIDELDRCKPEFSIKLIERVKHFFDIPNIVFVLSTNKTQLEESINSFYGFKESNNYLEKFIDLNIKFPNRNEDNYNSVIREYMNKYGIRGDSNDLLLISNLFDLNSRDLIRILQKIALMNGLQHIASPVFAFIYLAMQQKSLNPSKMNQKDFFDHFVNLLILYVKNRPSFRSVVYDYDNLPKFADQYSVSRSDEYSGLQYILKYYYLEYRIDGISDGEDQIKNQLKRSLRASINDRDGDLVKSWSNYINSGFIIE